MRLDGTLTKWNDDRGFGFIAPRQGGAEVFVHVSSFPRDGQRPRVGDLLTFEIEIAPDGRKRAKAVSRPIRIGAPRPREQRPSREGRGMRKRILPLTVNLFWPPAHSAALPSEFLVMRR
jgi:cold shock CspA family protein